MPLKKIGTILVLVVLSLEVSSMCVAAAGTTVSIGSGSTDVGGTVVVPLMIHDVSDLGYALIKVTYNASVVNVTAVTNSAFEDLYDTKGTGWVLLEGAQDSAGLNGDVKMCDVTLQAIGNAGDTSMLDLTDVYLEDFVYTPITVDAIFNGIFTISVNNPPQPNITSPQNGSMVSGVVTIVEVDESGEGDIVYNLFEYYNDADCNGSADDAGSQWFEIGNDTIGTDGWSVEWNTTVLHDCCYIIRATMGDTEGQTGQDTITIALSNHDPAPNITSPLNGSTLTDLVTIVEEDNGFDAGADIVYNLFEYYYDTNCNGNADDGTSWVEIYNDTDGSNGWKAEDWNTTQLSDCCYIIRATMGDKHGRTGEDTINVKIDHLPPVLTDTSANPLVIPDDTDNEPLWGENATLNVTVIDHSAVNVTINLSALGGSAVQPMTNIEGNIWSVTTNASEGSARWTGTTYAPYPLDINATDIKGKSNTSVSIELTVMKNGDVDGDGGVSYSDAMYLYKGKAGHVGFVLTHVNIADVDGDGSASYSDAMYLYKWKAGHSGFNVLH